VTLDLEGPAEKAPTANGVRWCPLRMACAGDGPYVLAAPRGALTLTIRTGATEAVACLLDGDLFELGGATGDVPLVRTIRAVRAGPHTLVVAARGRESRILRFTLKDGEVRTLEVALPPRR